MQFKTYRQALDYLVRLDTNRKQQIFSNQERVTQSQTLATLLGNPQEARPATHVAGTSGKGTVCYLIDALLRAHTKRTGLTQDPHVYDIREHIQVNGQLISERVFVRTLNTVLQHTRKEQLQLSCHETLVAMAFVLFGHSRLDYSVIETIHGGQFDSTNVIKRDDKVCVLTRISPAPGASLEQITQEKAGIIHKGNQVIALRQEPEINGVIEQRCREQHASLQWVDQTGDYQKTNDALARAACKVLAGRDGWAFDDALAEAVLEQVFIPGRFEKRSFKDHLVILDGAQNPQKFSALANRIRREGKNPVTVILSLAEEQSITACLETLRPIARRIIIPGHFSRETSPSVRPLTAELIGRHCQKLGIEYQIEKSPRQALSVAAQFAESIVATGSFSLIGELDSAF